MSASPRCQSKLHPNGCNDPQCPERMAAFNSIEVAVQTGDVDAMLAAAPAPRKRRSSFVPGPEEKSWVQEADYAKMSAPTSAAPAPAFGLALSERDQVRYRESILANMHQHMRPKTDPRTGRRTVSIFRSGVVEAPTERLVEGESYQQADERAPAGHRGRTKGIFASPTLDTGARWLTGNHMMGFGDYNLRELRVDPDTTRVYSVSNWEKVFRAEFSDKQAGTSAGTHAAIDRYWAESMTLAEWYSYVETNPGVDTRDWEILLAPEDIQQVKPVSMQRVIDNSFREWEGQDLARIAEQQRRDKRRGF